LSINRASTRRFIAIFVLPTLILYSIFYIYPLIQSIYYSFQKWSGYTNVVKFVGFDNYRKLSQDSLIPHAIWNDFVILFWKEVLIIVFAMFFAIAVTRLGFGKRESGFYRIIFFFPNMISIVIIGLLWSFVYHPSIGLLNAGLQAIGLESLTHAWLGEMETAVPALIPVASWAGVGFFMIVFIAGINSIPEEIYEASRIDGAGEWKQLFRITIPLVWQHVKFAMLTILFTTLSGNYVFVLVMTNGGPDNASQVLGSYIYQLAFQQSNVGYAMAVAVLLLAITLVITGIANKLLNRETYEI